MTVTDIPGLDEEIEVSEGTGSYDTSFFAMKPAIREVDQHLNDARVGLGLFLDEAVAALETEDLSVDQRLHIATIVSYVEALGTRFDKVRSPEFGRNKRPR